MAKAKFSSLVVAMIILLNGIFTAVYFYVFLKVGSGPGELAGFWFAFTTGELWMLAGIKKTKVRRKKCDGDKLEAEADQP